MKNPSTKTLGANGSLVIGQSSELLFVMAIWGLTSPALKFLTGDFDAVILSALRLASGFAVIFFCLYARVQLRMITGQTIALICLSATFTVYLFQILTTQGIHMSTATNGALITAFQPLLASVTAMAFLGERIDRQRWVGLSMGLCGAFAIFLATFVDAAKATGTGDTLIFGGVLAYCVGTSIAQYALRRIDAITLTVCTQALGSCMLFFHAAGAAWWKHEPPRLSCSFWLWVLVFLSGALSTGLGGMLWYRAIAKVGAARASLWLYWVPVFGVAGSVVFLKETLSPWHIVGLVLVLTGTYISTRRKF
ncbi:multidrug DMT transporter permease [Pandoraea terrae]|uniref:Multidrug DMT transporter permease n=1 Tax=Pandoraea terrae TaxID=1537710 RepID=A0A5E4ZAR4_9BURK|nr:DMT family transporter [Pandoraea terrae]VVE57767.1 multidrug DMT transporter permease [Pandoraea terrae]